MSAVAGTGDASLPDRSPFFALSFDLFLTADLHGSFIDANPAWERVLGFTLPDLLGRSFLDLVHRGDAPAVHACLDRLIDGEVAAFDCRLRAKDGGYRWLSWSIRPDLDAKLLHGAGRDSTQAIEAQDAHREHEELFALMTRSAERQQAALREQTRMLDMANDSIMVYDLDGRVLFWNHGAEQMYGWSRNEAMGRPVQDLLQTRFPTSRDVAIAALTSDGRWEGELQALRRDGKVITVRSRWALHRDDETGRELVLSVNEDTTERRRTEQALQETEARFRAMFESAAIGIALEDMAGRIVEANPALEAMLGVNGEELRFRGLADFVLPEDRHNDDEMARGLVYGARTEYRIEKRFRRADGVTVPGRVTASLVRDASGPRFVIVMVEDLSLALIDELTGLNNRRSFIAFGEQQLLMSDRTGRALALLFVDVDGMKAINDGFGHQEGDRALMAVAQILSRTFRAADFIARIGGDEFCVVLAGTEDDAGRAVDRLQGAVGEWNLRVAPDAWRLSLSAGAGRYEPGSGRSMEDLIRQADTAMYRQKLGRAVAE